MWFPDFRIVNNSADIAPMPLAVTTQSSLPSRAARRSSRCRGVALCSRVYWNLSRWSQENTFNNSSISVGSS